MGNETLGRTGVKKGLMFRTTGRELGEKSLLTEGLDLGMKDSL